MNAVRLLRLWFAIQPDIDHWKQLTQMKFSWPLFFVVLGLVMHTLADINGVAPPAWHPYISHTMELLTAIAGFKCLFINPDGTSVKYTWTPELGQQIKLGFISKVKR